MGMVLINGLDASGFLLSVGVVYVYSGLYFGITSPVQPMKVIGAYALANAVSNEQIQAASLLAACVFLIIGFSGIADFAGRKTPLAVVRGVQTAIGLMLIDQGAKFIFGISIYQQQMGTQEPYLNLQAVGGAPIGLILGGLGLILVMLLRKSKRYPAMLLLIASGMMVSLIVGPSEAIQSVAFGLHPPMLLPDGWPPLSDFVIALSALVLPQVPMTLGNAVIAQADLSKKYFGEASSKVTYKALCLSLGVCNLLVFLFGGMPLAHGAEGLAARYRFGARSAGSNLFIGLIFILSALIFGDRVMAVLGLIPLSILGVLLMITGLELVLNFRDLKNPQNVCMAGLVIALTFFFNLTIGFIAGLITAWILNFFRPHSRSR
jgi:SulP family sulfate permease